MTTLTPLPPLALVLALTGIGTAHAAEQPTLAVLPLAAAAGMDESRAALLTEPLVQEVRNSGAFSQVITPQEVAALMPPEQQKQLLRCAQDECAMVDQEMAGALGVSHLLVGSVGRLAESWLLNLRIIQLSTSLVVTSVSERIRGRNEDDVLDAMEPAVRQLLSRGGFALAPVGKEASSPRSALLQGAGGLLALATLLPTVLATLSFAGATGWVLGVFFSPAFSAALPNPDRSSPVLFVVSRFAGAGGLLTAGGVLAVAAIAALVVGVSLFVVGRIL